MWKIMSLSLILLLPIGCASPKKETPSHRDLISSRYPHTLIGDDYGILTEDDLALSSCVAKPSPFTLESVYHPYWQCFSTEKARVECEDGEYDSDEKSMMVVMAIVVSKDDETHEYLSRRGIPLDSCKEYMKEWKNLTAGQSHVCISGALTTSNQPPAKEWWSWIFEAYKTKKGCDSYFDSGCNLQAKIQQGCNLDEMTASISR